MSATKCVYAAVAAPDGSLLVERSLSSGNADVLAQKILHKLDKGADRAGGRRSYSMGSDGYAFRFLWGPGGYTFVLLERGISNERVWRLLGQIRERWEARYGEVRALPVPTSDAAPFASSLEELLLAEQRSALDGGNAELGMVNEKLANVKNVMADSIEQVLERGDKIDHLVDRASQLEQNAFAFTKSSTALRRTYRWQAMRCRVLVGAALVAGLLIVLSSACGGPGALLAGCGLRGGSTVPAAAADGGFEPVDSDD